MAFAGLGAQQMDGAGDASLIEASDSQPTSDFAPQESSIPSSQPNVPGSAKKSQFEFEVQVLAYNFLQEIKGILLRHCPLTFQVG